VERIPEERTVKQVFKNIPEGERSFGKRRKRWLNATKSDLTKMGVRGPGKIARDRDVCKFIPKEARVQHGQYSQRRRRRKRRRRGRKRRRARINP
jgi:hypothetical protein